MFRKLSRGFWEFFEKVGGDLPRLMFLCGALLRHSNNPFLRQYDGKILSIKIGTGHLNEIKQSVTIRNESIRR